MPGDAKPVFLLFLVIAVAGTSGGFMAANRARSVPAWTLLCTLFPPLLLILYFTGPLREVAGDLKKTLKMRRTP